MGEFALRLLASVSPSKNRHQHEDARTQRRDMSWTYRRYTVSPTAVPIKAALTAVETIEPASPLRFFMGGAST